MDDPSSVSGLVPKHLGIDPGSRVTGFGVVSLEAGKIRHVEHGFIRPKAGDRGSRLIEIYHGLVEVLTRHHPESVAMEEVFMAKNVTTALVLGQARGVILGACISQGLRVHDYPSTNIKRIVTGDGHASKHKVQFMVRAVLELRETPQEDAADALAVAICHCRSGDAHP